MFYWYQQNGSGGMGCGSADIIVEADSAEEADAIAEKRAGVYFDGVDSGLDCSCCGDRWYRADDADPYFSHGDLDSAIDRASSAGGPVPVIYFK